MADTQNGVLSTPTLQDLFTLMEKRRSELKRLKEGRLKADNLVRRARSSFSVGSGTPAAVCPQDEFNTPFHDVKAGSSRDQDFYRIHSAATSVHNTFRASSGTPISHQSWEHGIRGNDDDEEDSIQYASDAKWTTSQALREAREETNELHFVSNQRTELDANESLTALRAKLDEYDEVDLITREADERMVELCDNLARSKQELETVQQQLRDVSNEVAMKREDNLTLSRELHGALKRVEEYERQGQAVRAEEKEWQDRQKSIAAETEEDVIQLRKKLALEKQKNRIALAKRLGAAQQQASQSHRYYKPSLLSVFIILVGLFGVLGCVALLLVVTGELSSCSVDIVRVAY